MSDGGHGVVITTRDIYDQLVQLTGKVDGLIAAQKPVASQVQDHEARIRNLEAWRYALPTSLVLSIGGVVAALFGA